MRNKNYAILWISYTLSLMGDYLVIVLLPFYIYNITGSAIATGTMFIFSTLPGVIFGSFGGVLADKINRKNIMILCDVIRAISSLLLIFVSKSNIWIVYLFALNDSVFSQFFFPARASLLLENVDEKDLTSMNSIDATTNSLISVIGPLLSGVVVSYFGILWISIVNSLSFLMSALLLYRLKYNVKKEFNQEMKIRYMDMWKNGFISIMSNNILRRLFSISMIIMIAQGFLSILMVIFVTKVLMKSSIHWSWMITSQSIGSIIGGLLVNILKRRLEPSKMIFIGLLGSSIIFYIIIHSQNFVSILVYSIIIGVFASIYFIGLQIKLQISIDKDLRGRVYGFLKSTRSLSMIIGVMIATFLEYYLDIISILSIVSLMYFTASIVSYNILRLDKYHIYKL